MEIAVPFVEESVIDVADKINKYIISNEKYRVKMVIPCYSNGIDTIHAIVIFTDEKEK